MDVTPSGIFTLTSVSLKAKAPKAIVVTPFGISKVVSVLPIAYASNVLPSFEYKLPFMSLYSVLAELTVKLVRLGHATKAASAISVMSL